MFKKLFNAVMSAPFTRSLYKHPKGSWDLMLYVTQKGSMLLEIHNDPYGADQAELARIIGHALEKGVMGHRIHFTPDHDKAAHPSYRVIIAFNPPKDFDFKRMAHGEVPPVADHGDKNTVLAIFANADQALVAAAGSLVKTACPEDKAFHSWFVSLGTHLFPKEKG